MPDLYGKIVKWSRGRKPLGIVVHQFLHRLDYYAVVEKPDKVLIVVRISDKLVVVG